MTTCAMSWDPFRDIETMLSGLDHANDRAWSTAGATPGINVYATEETAVVTSELPGVQTGDITVQLYEDVLTIAAKRISDPTATDWLARERPDLDFSRSVNLPFSVDPEHIEAGLKNGVLTISLKRTASDRPRHILVNHA
jgi:HSP20 family protein